MKIQLVHIADCPNTEIAYVRARCVLDALGLGQLVIDRVLVNNSAEAGAIAFAGSPTLLLDGDDLFPSEGRTQELACRVYASEHGLSGAPTLEQLETAIRARIDGGATSV